MEENLRIIAIAAGSLKYSDWCKVREAVEKAFASERSRVKLDDPEAIEKMLKMVL